MKSSLILVGCLLSALLLGLSPCIAADSSPSLASPLIIDVWPGLAPGEQSHEIGRMIPGKILEVTDVSRPQILLFPAPGKSFHPAVIICPGGGYAILALDLEGTEVAHWLNGLGITAAVLEYRIPNKRDAAFQDGQRALSLLRARSKEFDIDPHRLGVLGFSAGGHLVARLAAGFGERSYLPIDDIDKASDRPDFAALIYPAYLIDSTGLPNPEVKPHLGMPPIFLTQTQDDPVLCAPAYATALQAAGVPQYSAFYAFGKHGYGLRTTPDKPVHAWSDEAANWLKSVTGISKGK